MFDWTSVFLNSDPIPLLKARLASRSLYGGVPLKLCRWFPIPALGGAPMPSELSCDSALKMSVNHYGGFTLRDTVAVVTRNAARKHSRCWAHFTRYGCWRRCNRLAHITATAGITQSEKSIVNRHRSSSFGNSKLSDRISRTVQSESPFTVLVTGTGSFLGDLADAT